MNQIVQTFHISRTAEACGPRLAQIARELGCISFITAPEWWYKTLPEDMLKEMFTGNEFDEIETQFKTYLNYLYYLGK